MNIICIGMNRFSYNNIRALSFLNANNIEYEYINYNDYLKFSKEKFKDKQLLILDDNIPIKLYEIGIIEPDHAGVYGKAFHKIKKYNPVFFNNILNHFRCYNKWHVFNMLAGNNLPVLPSICISKKDNLKNNTDIFRIINPPFFVRETECFSSFSPNDKLDFISTGIEDLHYFYDEHLKDTWDLFLVQEYIPHDYVIEAHCLFDDVRFTITYKDKSDPGGILDASTSPYINTTEIYDRTVNDIKEKLKLNCFSVSFLKDKIIKLKAPMCFEKVDSNYNTDSINSLLRYILNGSDRNK